MVKQVGPAQGKPITILAFEVAVIDWLPGARIPSWPGSPGGSIREAGDTFAVRPVLSTTRPTSPRFQARTIALLGPVRHRPTTSSRARGRPASSLRSDRAPRGSGLDRRSARDVMNTVATANGWLRHRVPIVHYANGPPNVALFSA